MKFSNKQILEDLKKIDEEDIMGKCVTIIEIYLSKEDLYKGKENIVFTKNINKEGDDKWFEEIQKNKQNKKEKEKDKDKDKDKEPQKRKIKNAPKKK